MSNKSKDFIREIIDSDLASGKHQTVVTRFPPEPNGYLHIGHAKSICLNFGLAEQYRGKCNLRFDDTNPAKEEQEYVDSICEDVRWLGFDFGKEALFASDYFDTMYEIAEKLIREGKAYVCSLNEEEIREYRGSLKEAGKASPYRDRSVEENLRLFREMREGKHADGAHVLRAKIDMAASNMKLRDPLLYRIRHETHHRTGDAWPIYPMYDYAHPLEDALEGITHSICTLEFENNRAVYDWVVANADLPAKPKQTEFARLGLDYTVMSKRKILKLVEAGKVSGWDDPRMPTISGMRRRGYRPEAIRRFCDMIGVAKNNSVVDIGKLEFAVRDDLNQVAPRAMAVLRPIKLVITNYTESAAAESLEAPSFPPDIGKEGTRQLAFGRELWIERDDFQEKPEPGFKRLAPGRWIRLRYAYCLRCDEVICGENGEVSELRCTYAPESLGAKGPEGEKIWGVIHWVSASSSLSAEFRLYDRLFSASRPDAGDDFMQHLNPNSLEVLQGYVESGVVLEDVGPRFQFERQGYFTFDSVDSKEDALVFNRIIGLRDSWKKSETKDASKTESAPKEKSARAKSRPKSRSKADIRKAARAADEFLAGEYARLQELGVRESEADLLSGSRAWCDRFATLSDAGMGAAEAAKWLVNEHPRVEDEPLPFASDASEFIAVVEASRKRISKASARRLWQQLAGEAGKAEEIIASEGMEQVADSGAVDALVQECLAANPDKVEAYKSGKKALMGFFVGQVMRAAKGSAKADDVKTALAKFLDA